MRAVIYARYSSQNQREASIEDQVRLCRKLVERQGWTYLHAYTDRAVSGASPLRAGYQKLMEDARSGEFDVVVAEALDRLSRDQEDIAGLYKRLSFSGIKIVTLAAGEVTDLHVGLKGTMNALYLKDLAQKTRRGLEGRVRQGKSAGGLCYGYHVARETDANGDPLRGGRCIDPSEATVVRRILREYASGASPRAIAVRLNREGIAGPRAAAWGASTIQGNPKRGTGILNNELYIGRLVWNRLRYIKDPETGKRISRLNPESAWIIESVPDLRIIEGDLWEAVHRRQAAVRRDTTGGNRPRPWNGRRNRHILSGLIKCGSCGGGMVLVGGVRYGCATARNKGLCDNRHTFRRETLEESVFAGLKSHLMRPELVKEFRFLSRMYARSVRQIVHTFLRGT